MALITPKCTISYPHLFTPWLGKDPKPGQRPRFTALLLFPIEMDEEDKALFRALQVACAEKAAEKWGSMEKVKALVDGEVIKMPLSRKNLKKDGSLKWDNTKFSLSAAPWSYDQPGVVARWADPNDPKKRPMKILNPNTVFAGCVVKASVNPFVYDSNGNSGVALGLGNIQLWQSEGVERLDNRTAAEDEFGAEMAPEGALESLAAASGPAGGGDVPVASGAKGAALADLFN